MTHVVRPLLRVVAGALLLTAALVLWIRGEPVDLATPVQVALSILLVLAVVVLGAAVLWVEHDAAQRDSRAVGGLRHVHRASGRGTPP